MTRLLSLVLIVFLNFTVYLLPAHGAYSGDYFEQLHDLSNTQLPTLDINGTSSIANNQSVVLSALASVCPTCTPSYFWEAEGGSFSGGSTSSTITWTPPVINNLATYYIRGTVGDGKGNVASASFPVTVLSTSPACTAIVSTPTFYSPGLYSESNSVSLSWQTANNATQYVLHESTDPNFTTKTIYNYSAPTTSVTLTNKPNGTYYYRVTAQNSCGGSSWSNTEQFEVRANAAPNTPSSPSPANNASGVSRTPYLSWTGGDPDGTADYAVEYGTDPTAMWYIQGYNSSNKFNNSMQIT